MAVFANVPGSSTDTFFQMCSGRIGTHSWVMIASRRGQVEHRGRGVRRVHALDALDVVVVRAFAVGSLIARLNVYATSAAVSGTPSDHVTPERIVNVQVMPSSECVHDVARPGTGL